VHSVGQQDSTKFVRYHRLDDLAVKLVQNFGGLGILVPTFFWDYQSGFIEFTVGAFKLLHKYLLSPTMGGHEHETAFNPYGFCTSLDLVMLIVEAQTKAHGIPL
jgi:hypothetical protein